MAVRGIFYLLLAFNGAIAVAAGFQSMLALQSNPLHGLALIGSIAGAAVTLGLIIGIYRNSLPSPTAQRIAIGARPIPSLEELRAERLLIASRFTEAKNAYDPIVREWKQLVTSAKTESDPTTLSDIQQAKDNLANEYYSLRSDFYAVKDEIGRMDQRIGATIRRVSE